MQEIQSSFWNNSKFLKLIVLQIFNPLTQILKGFFIQENSS